MQLGFLTTILADLSFEEVLAFASDEGFRCLEVCCWPPGKAERRYAGVTHIDVTDFNEEKAGKIKEQVKKAGVSISALAYYPNCLDPDPAVRGTAVDHLKEVIRAAPQIDVRTVTTFIGRDWTKSLDANWPLFREVWPDILHHAEKHGVNIGIENCPMIFSNDEWPGGKNLAYCPAVWQRMFDEVPTPHLGLNFDPSHCIWLQIDYVRCIREFAKRFHHVHAKDARLDPDDLYAVGTFGLGWHTPKIPGLGDVNWSAFFSALTDAGYTGPVCIEVEDRSFEGSLENRKRSLRQSKRYLEQFV